MPYTPEELRELTWYQNLIKADERDYLANRELLVNNAATSNESQLIRNESNQVLIFEDPFKDELLEDESTKITHNTKVNRLKNGDGDYIIDELLNRGFNEL